MKHVNPLKHLKFTGVDNFQILKNLELLDKKNKAIVIRVPVIPGFNATAGEMRKMAEFAANLSHPHSCNLLPCHSYAESKYRVLNRGFPKIENPSPELMKEFCDIWTGFGIETRLGG